MHVVKIIFKCILLTMTETVASVRLRLANGCFAVTSADSLRAQNDSIDFSFVGMIKRSVRFSPLVLVPVSFN